MEFYNKHYAAIDDDFRITSIWSDGPKPSRSTDKAVCINKKGSYQVYLNVDGVRTEENPSVLTQDYGISLYRWDPVARKVIRRAEEEIEAERAILSLPTADEIRARRDKLLAETDWTQVLDAPIDTETREAYRAYRQALRDVTEQEGFPTAVVWPELPDVGKADPDPVDTAFDVLTGGGEG